MNENVPCIEFITPCKVHESLFIGYCWNKPLIYKRMADQKITRDTFTLEIWWFYYNLGKIMFESGIRVFDDKTVYSFLISNPEIERGMSATKQYNDYGGYITIEQLIKECKNDEQNVEYHLDEMKKFELLRYYEREGLLNPNKEIELKNNKKVLLKNLLASLSMPKVQSFFKVKFAKANINLSGSRIKVSNFFDGLKESAQEFNKGESMGLPFFNSPRLNRICKGVKKGDLVYLVLSSGVGKTTFSINKFILGLIEANEKALIFANEEGKMKFHHTFISTVASEILKTPIPRERLSLGNYGKEEWDIINAVNKWVDEHNPDLLKMCEIQKYILQDVIDNIELYKPMGYNYVFFDTFKPDGSIQDKARWEKFSDHAQDIYNCIKPSVNNVGCLATIQLKIGSDYRYLDLDCIGKAKEVVEVADKVLMGRLLFEDEYPGESKAVKVYDKVYDENTNMVVKEEKLLDESKEYMVLFIPKNRDGGKAEQIIYEVDYNNNVWNEIGYTCIRKNSSRGGVTMH